MVKELNFAEMENLQGGSSPAMVRIRCTRYDESVEYFNVTMAQFLLGIFNNAATIADFEQTYAGCEQV